MDKSLFMILIIIVVVISFSVLIYYTFSARLNIRENPSLLCKPYKCKHNGSNSQVYNIKGNFTYDQANKICTEECGQLATTKELHESYKAGASWMNPSWSANRLVLFPSQKKIKDGNITIEQGLNGGKQSKNKLYGANCFGPKPKNSMFKPKCPPQKKGQCKAPIGSINPFNNLQWSRY